MLNVEDNFGSVCHKQDVLKKFRASPVYEYNTAFTIVIC